jgi:predicted CXXCH cytochrome family protein
MGYSHAPFAKGECLTCHVGHGKRADLGLKSSGGDLCYGCHEQNDHGGVNGHLPAKKGECLTCHSPHFSQEKKLLVKNELEVCLSCHEKLDRDLNRYTPHQPFAAGNCSKCHNPHQRVEENKLLLKDSGQELCFSCHKKLKAAQKKEHGHAPFQEGDCLGCHAPHATDTTMLTREDGGTLCLSCHTSALIVIKLLPNTGKVGLHMSLRKKAVAIVMCLTPLVMVHCLKLKLRVSVYRVTKWIRSGRSMCMAG